MKPRLSPRRGSPVWLPTLTGRPRGAAPTGFTLVEILASLAVLAIGLSAVVAMVLGSGRITNATSNRNVAAMVIAEAAADIERRHLIADTSHGSNAAQVGLLIETLTSPNPNTHDGVSYQNIAPGAGSWDAWMKPPYRSNPPPLQNVNTLVWPLLALGQDPKYYGGALRPVAATNTVAASGGAYRVIYRLERHPAWHPHIEDPVTGEVSYAAENPQSPFAGIYVLTLTVYAERARLAAKLEQISDPVVMYVRDKKAR